MKTVPVFCPCCGLRSSVEIGTSDLLCRSCFISSVIVWVPHVVDDEKVFDRVTKDIETRAECRRLEQGEHTLVLQPRPPQQLTETIYCIGCGHGGAVAMSTPSVVCTECNRPQKIVWEGYPVPPHRNASEKLEHKRADLRSKAEDLAGELAAAAWARQTGRPVDQGFLQVLGFGNLCAKCGNPTTVRRYAPGNEPKDCDHYYSSWEVCLRHHSTWMKGYNDRKVYPNKSPAPAMMPEPEPVPDPGPPPAGVRLIPFHFTAKR